MKKEYIALLITVILTLRTIALSTRAKNKIIELFSNKRWLINLLIIVAFISYILYETNGNDTEDSKRSQKALIKAIIAFIIAIYSEIGLTIAPFWTVFVIAYWLDLEV